MKIKVCIFSFLFFFYIRSATERDAKTVMSWDFDRIIPCHGVSFECTTGPIGYLWIIICFFRTLLKAMAKRLGAQRMLIFWTSLSLRVLPVGSLEPGGRCSIEQTILLHTDLLIIKNDEITLSPPLKQQTITIMSDSDRQLVIAYFLNSGCQWNWKYPASSAGGIMTYLQ